jgi:hypothetical protein
MGGVDMAGVNFFMATRTGFGTGKRSVLNSGAGGRGGRLRRAGFVINAFGQKKRAKDDTRTQEQRPSVRHSF